MSQAYDLLDFLSSDTIRAIRPSMGKVVIVGGCFDIVHLGHIQFLRKSKSLGDTLIVALESDEFIRRTKNRNPINDIETRASNLINLEVVDTVLKLPYFETHVQYDDLVGIIKPDVIAVTKPDLKIQLKQKIAQNHNCQIVEVIDYVEGYSTTSIINKKHYGPNFSNPTK